MGSIANNTTYEFRIFVPKCETYAILLDDQQITGIYGPLEYDEVLFSALPHFKYEDRPSEVDWVKSNLCDFVMCETEYDDAILWI